MWRLRGRHTKCSHSSLNVLNVSPWCGAVLDKLVFTKILNGNPYLCFLRTIRRKVNFIRRPLQPPCCAQLHPPDLSQEYTDSLSAGSSLPQTDHCAWLVKLTACPRMRRTWLLLFIWCRQVCGSGERYFLDFWFFLQRLPWHYVSSITPRE